MTTTRKQTKKLHVGDSIRFLAHWRKYANNSEGWLSGEVSFVHSGDVAVVVQIEKKGDKRPLLRFPAGEWCWAYSHDVEVINK